jgi:uncharacterized RDD family membrane protein YckC
MPPEPRAAAPLFDRIAACLFDLAIAALLGGAASKLATLALATAGLGDGGCELVRKLLQFCTYAALCVLPAAGPSRATLGQRWMGLQLSASSGAGLGIGQSFGRWLAFVAAALPLGAGLLLALGPARRPFQDLLCDSRVCRARAEGAGAGA